MRCAITRRSASRNERSIRGDLGSRIDRQCRGWGAHAAGLSDALTGDLCRRGNRADTMPGGAVLPTGCGGAQGGRYVIEHCANKPGPLDCTCNARDRFDGSRAPSSRNESCSDLASIRESRLDRLTSFKPEDSPVTRPTSRPRRPSNSVFPVGTTPGRDAAAPSRPGTHVCSLWCVCCYSVSLPEHERDPN